MKRPILMLGLLAAISGACDRSAPPIAPIESVPARGPGPAPSETPVPPPKAAPDNAVADSPASPAAAAPQVEDKPATPLEQQPEDKPRAAKPNPRAREIRPRDGATHCIEMYGTCTPPPDQLCTSTALTVDCGQRSQVPSSGEWVHCVCGR